MTHSILPLLSIALLSPSPSPSQGTTDGHVDQFLEIGNAQGGFEELLVDSDNFGASVAFIGDLDGDGLGEVIVGTPGDSDGGSRKGALYILFRDGGGLVRASQKISSTEGGFTGQLETVDQFGVSVTGIGDLDGNGVPDIAVGAAGDGVTTLAGAVWILFLRGDGTVVGHQKIAAGSGGFGGTTSFASAFGSAVTCLGDLDGDGTLELAIGQSGAIDGPLGSTGAVWIVSLDTSGTVVREQKIDSSEGGFGGSLSGTDNFGFALCAVGDLDGDGVGDLAVGSDSSLMSTGVVWLLFLCTDGTVHSERELSPTTEPLIAALIAAGDHFGSSLTLYDDYYDSSVANLVVGASDFNGASSNQGAILFLDLGAGGVVDEVQLLDGADPLLGANLFSNARYGSSLATVSDGPWPWIMSGVDSLDNPPFIIGSVFALRMCRGDLVAEFSADVTSGLPPLTVQFQDLSTGTGITGRAWDFGDGMTSTDASPTHFFPQGGAYDVTLFVEGNDSFCGETKVNFILSNSSAYVTSRNGSGINPEVLRFFNDPLIGTSWQPYIDGTGQSWSGLTFFLVYEEPLVGFTSSFGELLVNLASPQSALEFGFFAGGQATFTVSIPNDASLLGLDFSSQAFINLPGILTNALDLTIGP